MAKVTAHKVPNDSLLAPFGGPDDYRDCFIRDMPGAVSLAEFIERFYGSLAFLPERLVLRVIGGHSSLSDARAVARGEADRFGAWEVVERRESEILLHSKGTGTASWFAVEPLPSGSRAVGQAKMPSGSAAVERTKTPSNSGVEEGPLGQPVGRQTRLYFGSWVGNIGKSGWNSMLRPHVWYSRLLLGAV